MSYRNCFSITVVIFLIFIFASCAAIKREKAMDTEQLLFLPILPKDYNIYQRCHRDKLSRMKETTRFIISMQIRKHVNVYSWVIKLHTKNFKKWLSEKK